MAVASGRVKTKSLASLIDKSFLAATDKTKDTPPTTDIAKALTAATSKAAAAIGKSSIFDTGKVPSVGSILAAAGIIPSDGNPACPVNENVLPKNQDNRLLNAPSLANGCTTTVSSHLVAKSLLSELTAALPESKIAGMETMIKDSLSTHLPGLSMPNLDKVGSLTNSMKSMGKMLSVIGGTIREKSDTLRLLKCVNKSGGNAAHSTAVNKSVLNDALSQSLCMGKEQMAISMAQLISSGKATTSDIISSTITVLKSSGADKSKYISALSTIRTLTPNLTPSDLAKIKPYLGSLSSGMANLDVKSTNPTAEYNDMIASINSISPGWSGGGSGSTDISRLKGNPYAAKLASKSLMSNTVSAASISSTPKPIAVTDPSYLAKMITAANQPLLV